jgi:hypothetical protein
VTAVALSGIVAGLGETEYHAHPALSSTGARLLLDSPARFKYRMAHPYTSDAFDLGTAVHTKVLGTGYPLAVLDFADFRSKAAQQARDEALEAGQVPILASVARVVDAMAEAVLAHPKAREVLELDGLSEASVFGTDPVTGVAMRARFDHLQWSDKEPAMAVDLKTTAGSASEDGFKKSAAAYGYHIQQAHYLDTLDFALEPWDTQMVFVVCEKDAPYFVAVHRLDEQFALIGQDEAKRAREIYRRCLDTDEWPGYGTDIIQTSPPAWLVYKHQDQYEPEMEIR